MLFKYDIKLKYLRIKIKDVKTVMLSKKNGDRINVFST